MSDPIHPTSEQRQRAMTEALRAWDPEAEVTLESGTGRLMVMTTLPTERVIALLQQQMARAPPTVHHALHRHHFLHII